PAQPVTLRDIAASVLARSKLDDSQLQSLIASLGNAGPLELPKILPAFSRSTNEDLGLRLVKALESARSARSLRPDQVRPSVTNFPPAVRAAADTFLATINTDAAKQKEQLEGLSTSLALNFNKPDIRRGQAVFN